MSDDWDSSDDDGADMMASRFAWASGRGFFDITDEMWLGEDEEFGVSPPDDAHLPEKWRFMYKWFHVLDVKLSPSDALRYDTHDVRIGRDPDDWRIDVTFVEELGRTESLDTVFERIRKIREAVVLTTLFAEVDYDTWLSELQRTSRFQPAEYMDLVNHRLPRKYSTMFFDKFSPEWYSWERIQHFFGVENYNEDFTTDLKKLAELAAEEGVDVHAIKSIPMELHCFHSHFCGLKRTQQCQALHNLQQSAMKIDSIERERKTGRQSKRYHGAPVFNLDEGIILSLRAMEIRSRLFEQIRYFVESGLHIKCLTLPTVWLAGEYESDEDFYDSEDDDPDDLIDDGIDYWVPLARSLTGNSPTQTHVSRLVLPAWYCNEPVLTAFCSGLATAKRLKFLRLEAQIDEGLFKKNVGWRTWAWLGYALFNEQSACSVEALSLAGFELDEENLDSLEDAMHAENPLAYLWRELTNPDDGFVCNTPSSRQVVRIASDANLKLYDSFDFFGETSILSPPLSSAIAMDDGPIVDVLLPGYGFCRVDRVDIISKKRRQYTSNVSTSHKPFKLKTLLLDFKPRRRDNKPLDAKYHLPRLLDIVGDTVTSLSIIAEDLDDESLATSLAWCPRLEHLSVGGMTLQSMKPITELYRQGIRLSSLHLHDLTVPMNKFDNFVKRLGSNTILQRLRIGILIDRPRDSLRKWNCQKFDKQLLTIPLDSRSRLAFLSILHWTPSASASTPRSQLSEDTIAIIFQFAAAPARRRVIEKRSDANFDRYC